MGRFSCTYELNPPILIRKFQFETQLFQDFISHYNFRTEEEFFEIKFA